MNHRMKLVNTLKLGYQTYYLFRCQYCGRASYIVGWLFWGKPMPGKQMTKAGRCPGSHAERRHLRYDSTG